MNDPVDLKPSTHEFNNETWVVKAQRLDPEWSPLTDEKGRKVHGWARIEETPAHMLGRVLSSGVFGKLTISDKAFEVRLVSTRDGKAFGAYHHGTHYATREEAINAARKGLVQQGKRYAKKYGGAS